MLCRSLLVKCPRCQRCAILALRGDSPYSLGTRNGCFGSNEKIGRIVCRHCAYSADADYMKVPEHLYLQDSRLGVTLFACNAEHLDVVSRFLVDGDHDLNHYPLGYRSGLWHMGTEFKLRRNRKNVSSILREMKMMLEESGEM